MDGQLTGRGLQLTLVGAFSLLSLLLAAVGLYGVLSYGVAQQTSEIGLRMALGASRSQVTGDLLRRTLILTGCGIAVGLVVHLNELFVGNCSETIHEIASCHLSSLG